MVAQAFRLGDAGQSCRSGRPYLAHRPGLGVVGGGNGCADRIVADGFSHARISALQPSRRPCADRSYRRRRTDRDRPLSSPMRNTPPAWPRTFNLRAATRYWRPDLQDTRGLARSAGSAESSISRVVLQPVGDVSVGVPESRVFGAAVFGTHRRRSVGQRRTWSRTSRSGVALLLASRFVIGVQRRPLCA